MLKQATGVVLIMLTAILYAKTYFSLKKQARLMADKKIAYSGKHTNDRKNECGDKQVETCGKRARRADDGDKRVEIEIERGENRNKPVENHIERDDDRIKRDENQTERVEGENKRVENHIERDDDRIKRGENQTERVEGENKRVENHIERDDGRMKRDESQIERVEDENKRIENSIELDDDQNRRVECHIESVEDGRGNITAKPCTSPRITSVSRTISSQNYCIKARNNANEQKFLNTIIIIAVIAAVTVFPAFTYGSLTKTVFQSSRTLHSLFTTILSLNFAANPFVYYLRLKRYRKTFKILYGCKGS